MKFVVCFVPLLVLLLVQDSTQAPGPKAQFGFKANIGLNDFIPFSSTGPAAKAQPRPAAPAPAPIIKNCTSITGSFAGHSGNDNGAQSNNTVEVKAQMQSCR